MILSKINTHSNQRISHKVYFEKIDPNTPYYFKVLNYNTKISHYIPIPSHILYSFQCPIQE